MKQKISDWRYSTAIVKQTQMYEYAVYPGYTTTFFGSADTTTLMPGYDLVKLTNGFYGGTNAGLILSPEPVMMKYGFNAGFYWNASNCDPVYNGGEGYVDLTLTLLTLLTLLA